MPGKVAFRFHSRDLNFVLGPAENGAPIRYRVTLDGAAPGQNCGVDCALDGSGTVREPRLYQLIRQHGPIVDRTFQSSFSIRGFAHTCSRSAERNGKGELSLTLPRTLAPLAWCI